MPSIRASDGASYSEAALGEVQSVARRPTNSVVRDPVDPARIYAALEDEVFDQSADLVVGERGDDCGAVAEAAPQATGDVVFSAAFPCLERARRADAPVARVESEHHLTQRDDVVPALVGW